MESRELCSAADGRAWKVDGRAQALVGPGLATPLLITFYKGKWTKLKLRFTYLAKVFCLPFQGKIQQINNLLAPYSVSNVTKRDFMMGVI